MVIGKQSCFKIADPKWPGFACIRKSLGLAYIDMNFVPTMPVLNKWVHSILLTYCVYLLIDEQFNVQHCWCLSWIHTKKSAWRCQHERWTDRSYGYSWIHPSTYSNNSRDDWEETPRCTVSKSGDINQWTKSKINCLLVQQNTSVSELFKKWHVSWNCSSDLDLTASELFLRENSLYLGSFYTDIVNVLLSIFQ